MLNGNIVILYKVWNKSNIEIRGQIFDIDLNKLGPEKHILSNIKA